MSNLSKEEFLAPDARKIESLDLPTNGKTVFLRKLTVDEQITYEAENDALDENDTKGFTSVALAFYMCTETGEQFISVDEARKFIGAKDSTDVAAIMKKGIKMNRGLASKAVEEAAGN